MWGVYILLYFVAGAVFDTFVEIMMLRVTADRLDPGGRILMLLIWPIIFMWLIASVICGVVRALVKYLSQKE